tara:strand:+ start:47 stop:337 length:291 start_codon:yes stop_codon:yes gene_type:complete
MQIVHQSYDARTVDVFIGEIWHIAESVLPFTEDVEKLKQLIQDFYEHVDRSHQQVWHGHHKHTGVNNVPLKDIPVSALNDILMHLEWSGEEEKVVS